MSKNFENNTYCDSPPIISLTEERLRQVELQKLNGKSKINSECISNISWLKREQLANDIWYTVKPWDNLWRIILENTHISLNNEQLKNILIHPGDKIQFWENIVYVVHNWKISNKINLKNEDKKIKKEINNIVQNVIPKPKKTQPQEESNILAKIDNHFNQKNNPHQKTENLDKNISYNDFSNLSLENKIKLVSNKNDNWYIELHFPNNDISKNIKISDIIPAWYDYVEIINPKHNKSQNYYNVYKIVNWELKSALNWEWYSDLEKLKNWLLIRPAKFDEKYSSKLIFKEDWNSLEEKIASQNEKIIRWLIWEQISETVKHLKKWSAINEKFIYSIIAQESKFDPNAKSSMNALWLWQINSITTAWVIEKSADLKSNIDNLSQNAPDYLFTVWKDNIPNWDNLNISYNKDWAPRVKWLKEQSFDPITNLKLTINHLLALDDKFSDIKNLDTRRWIIAAAYNWGETKIWKIMDEHSPKTIWKLKTLVNNSQTKDYITKVMQYYKMQTA